MIIILLFILIINFQVHGEFLLFVYLVQLSHSQASRGDDDCSFDSADKYDCHIERQYSEPWSLCFGSGPHILLDLTSVGTCANPFIASSITGFLLSSSPRHLQQHVHFMVSARFSFTSLDPTSQASRGNDDCSFDSADKYDCHRAPIF